MDIGMTVTTVELKKMEATEGMVLTNGDVYGKVIYLGVNDSPDNWREITDEEYAAIMAEQEAAELEDHS